MSESLIPAPFIRWLHSPNIHCFSQHNYAAIPGINDKKEICSQVLKLALRYTGIYRIGFYYIDYLTKDIASIFSNFHFAVKDLSHECDGRGSQVLKFGFCLLKARLLQNDGNPFHSYRRMCADHTSKKARILDP
jgi:hypothetical protein